MRKRTLNDYQQRILRVLMHIQTHLDEPLGLEDLAALAHFSTFHFHRVFRGMVGESLVEHIRRIRLERAAVRLKLGEGSVTAQAFAAGYESLEAFSRAFSRRFGLAPSVFATRWQEAREARAPSHVHYLPAAEDLKFEPLESDGIGMDIKIENRVPQRVAFIRHTGPYDQVGPAWQRLYAQLGMAGQLGPDSQCIGVSYDDPEVTPADRLRYDACVNVRDGYQPSGEIGVQTLAGGRYAVAIHAGPYDRLGETYSALLGQWLPSQGRKLKDAPCLEIYLNDATRTPPADLRTAVCVPLADED